MKLIKINQPQVSQSRVIPGLLDCRIDYEVKSARGRLQYAGPKFDPVMWHQVMSFFAWTYQETRSESQVRLYVNQKLGRWGAWAFPQAARTGLTAQELPVAETPEKALGRFASWGSEPTDDWLYFGTAHHHCGAGAFQSSTDERNEQNQDGLHLTVGKMDEDRHELHGRFYLDGHCFEADLSQFWEFDPSLAAMIPPEMHPELARFQMGAKITVDFPEVWRANVMAAPAEPPPSPAGWDSLELALPAFERLDEALSEIHQRCAARSVGEEQWMAELDSLSANPAGRSIIEACVRHRVLPEDLLAAMAQFEFEPGHPHYTYGE